MTKTIVDWNYDPNKFHKPINKIKNYRTYQMYVIKKGVSKPIPFGNVVWEDSVDTLGMKLSFSFPRNPQDYMMKNHDILRIGDKIIYKNKNTELFRGMITEMTINTYSREVVAHDYGFLLNKNKILKQFSKINSTKAIKDLCNSQGVKVGRVASLPATITEIYTNQSVADIINSILDKNYKQTGKKYFMELRKDKLYVERHGFETIKPISKPSANTAQFNPTKHPKDITKKHSLDNMSNKVVVISQDDKKSQTLHTAQNKASVNKYGQLQTVISVSKEEKSKARQLARNHLQESANPETSISLTMFGDDKVRSGRVIKLYDEIYGLNGNFLILNCKQEFNNNIRTMSLDVKEVK